MTDIPLTAEQQQQLQQQQQPSLPVNGETAAADATEVASLDDADYDRCRVDYVDEIAYLEAEFARLKSHLFDDRLAFIRAKELEVLDGRAPEYLAPLAQLTENCRIRLQVAKLTRQLRARSARHCLDCELQWAQCQLECETQLLVERLRGHLCQQIRAHVSGPPPPPPQQLQQQQQQQQHLHSHHRHHHASSSSNSNNNNNNNNSGSQQAHSEPRPVVVSGPVIIYQLSEAEILEDCAALLPGGACGLYGPVGNAVIG